MNHEFDNNQPDEYSGSNTDHNNQDSSRSNIDNSVYSLYGDKLNHSGDYYSSDSNYNNQTSEHKPYTIYPTPELSEEKEPKKKRRRFGALKFTAAAIAFGLIAGASFQGYYLLTQPKEQVHQNNNNTGLQATEVAQSSEDDNKIVSTNTAAGAVITDVSDVVDKVMPSIVAINSTVNKVTHDFFGREYTQQAQGSGSGIIIGKNGTELLLVTNNHVIEGAQTVEIEFVDGSKANAEIKGSDASTDLAVLSVNLNDLSSETVNAIKVATLGNSDDVKAGEMSIAIGNALGYGQSVTVGYVSAVNREVTINEQTMTLIQTDAAINPGNSGGALLNSSGELIGINSVKYASQEVEGMGYAIPISNAIPMINELMNREVISKDEQGFLGIDAATAQNVTELYAQRFNMPIGVYVNNVIENSPAEEAGLAQGDIITGLDNVKIETIDDLKETLGYKKAGQEVKLEIQKMENGKYVEKTLNVMLGKK
jgi:serine protease Do